MKPIPVIVSWSGGKDSALALSAALQDPELEVSGLLTTITAGYDRISMHGVRAALLRSQCAALGLPLLEVLISPSSSNADYEAALLDRLATIQAEGIRHIVFGDLFLEDIRAYRERVLSRLGMSGIFPLWGKDTTALARGFVAQRFRAVVVCVDPHQLGAEFCGRDYDWQLLADLPATCDPCGENGEFHTFVYDGPDFRVAVRFSHGETIERGGFVFHELIEP